MSAIAECIYISEIAPAVSFIIMIELSAYLLRSFKIPPSNSHTFPCKNVERFCHHIKITLNEKQCILILCLLDDVLVLRSSLLGSLVADY